MSYYYYPVNSPPRWRYFSSFSLILILTAFFLLEHLLLNILLGAGYGFLVLLGCGNG